ncbi:MAG: hypothetical protein OHK0053_05270 [Microscillaceae bacterium]
MKTIYQHLLLGLGLWLSPGNALAQYLPVWMEGQWIGVVYAPATQTESEITLVAQPEGRHYRVAFPIRGCQGDWVLVTADAQRAVFREFIFAGQSLCADEGRIVITLIDGDHLSYSYFSASDYQLQAYATLRKAEGLSAQELTPLRRENLNCEHLFLDLDKGTLNGMQLTAPNPMIKDVFPCFTDASPDNAEMNCGGGVFFASHGFNFYTGRDYIEVRIGFKGQLSQAVLGQKARTVQKLLGLPARTEVARIGNASPRLHYFYARAYGCLSLVLVKNKVVRVAIHASPLAETVLCE